MSMCIQSLSWIRHMPDASCTTQAWQRDLYLCLFASGMCQIHDRDWLHDTQYVLPCM
jgi:hypothetical protein